VLSKSYFNMTTQTYMKVISKLGYLSEVKHLSN